MKERNALRITALKETVQLTYQDALLLNVEELSAEWMRYQHCMDVCRSTRAILEDDFGMLYAALGIQDIKFDCVAAFRNYCKTSGCLGGCWSN